MPIYEYECNDCGQAFEFLMRGEEKAVCPACGKSHLTRALSVPAAHTTVSRDPTCPCGRVRGAALRRRWLRHGRDVKRTLAATASCVGAGCRC